MPKIIDLIRAHEAKGEKEPFFAFEFFPPRTKDGVTALYKRIARMTEQSECVSD